MRTVEVVSMWVEAPRVLQGGVEAELPVLDKARPPKLEAAGDHFDVPFPQRVIDHVFVLLDLLSTIPSGLVTTPQLAITSAMQMHHGRSMVEFRQWGAGRRVRAPSTHHDGAGAVDYVTAGLGVGVHRVDGRQQQLFLQVGAAPDLLLRLARLHRTIKARCHRIPGLGSASQCQPQGPESRDTRARDA